MRLSLISTILVTVTLKEAAGIALPNSQPQKYKIADTELGPVYSTVDPNQRRDLDDNIVKRRPDNQQKYKIADTAFGPVYSTVDPDQRRDIAVGLSKREDAYTPVEQAEVDAYIKKQYITLLKCL